MRTALLIGACLISIVINITLTMTLISQVDAARNLADLAGQSATAINDCTARIKAGRI